MAISEDRYRQIQDIRARMEGQFECLVVHRRGVLGMVRCREQSHRDAGPVLQQMVGGAQAGGVQREGRVGSPFRREDAAPRQGEIVDFVREAVAVEHRVLRRRAHARAAQEMLPARPVAAAPPFLGA